MRLMVVGTGYVGLVSGTCFAELGFEVICVDIDANKIAMLNRAEPPIYEPELSTLLQRNLATGRIKFTTELAAHIPQVDLILLAIGTPNLPNSTQVDLSAMVAAVQSIAPHLSKYTPIVIKSTVPPGTGRALHAKILAVNPAAKFDMISNPEFLREGAAVSDFMRPDRLIIGLQNPQNREIMSGLYRPLYNLNTPVVFTTLESAELIKYAANAFLATKIAFINEIADICETIDADVQVIAKALGLDARIGAQFLQAGPGYGGSCFPKDTVALQEYAQQQQAPSKIINAVITANAVRKSGLSNRVIKACNNNVTDVEIAILGVAFKANTDDIRESPALPLIADLVASGAKIRLFDPVANENARQYFKATKNISYVHNIKECVTHAQILIIITEWDEFRSLDLQEINALMRAPYPNAKPLFIDFRNIYDASDFYDLQLQYLSVGRSNKMALSQPQSEVLYAE